MAPPLTPMANLRWHVVKRALAEIRPATILEIGCGQGSAGARLAAMAPTYLGVEPDERSSSVARSRVEPLGGTVITGDHTAVPAGTTYDLVCAFEVLEHIEDDKAALHDWAEFVRPGGHLLLSVPAWQDRFGPMDELVGHFRRYSPAELRDRLSNAALEPTHVQLYGWPLGYALEAVRNRIAKRRGTASEDASVEARTAGSGRLLQPKALVGGAVRVATVPFQQAQRLVPKRGTGIVAVAVRR